MGSHPRPRVLWEGEAENGKRSRLYEGGAVALAWDNMVSARKVMAGLGIAYAELYAQHTANGAALHDALEWAREFPEGVLPEPDRAVVALIADRNTFRARLTTAEARVREMEALLSRAITGLPAGPLSSELMAALDSRPQPAPVAPESSTEFVVDCSTGDVQQRSRLPTPTPEVPALKAEPTRMRGAPPAHADGTAAWDIQRRESPAAELDAALAAVNADVLTEADDPWTCIDCGEVQGTSHLAGCQFWGQP